MAEEGKIDFDAKKVLEDGIITSCTLRHLSEKLEREERDEKLMNGPLSMVCTYPEGYKERQSLYSCLTCQRETGEVAGICFACSENCHDGHELIQLYTKRLFCCDCGNSKFKKKCKLFEEKLPINRKNRYDHNFQGNYCTCNKPYPLEENDPLFAVEMHQCFMCEDWFHPQHVNAAEILNMEDYAELVCVACVAKYPFIRPYHHVCEQEESKPAPVDETLNATSASCESETEQNTTTETSNQQGDFVEARKPSPVDNTLADNQIECFYKKIEAVTPNDSEPRGLVFLNVDWRPMLCRCTNCKRMYEDLECEFLLDEKDSIYKYVLANANELEKNHRDLQSELFDEIALRTNADVAHNAVAEIASLKRQLSVFFDKKSKDQNAITAEDIHDFFDDLKSKRGRFQEPFNEDQ